MLSMQYISDPPLLLFSAWGSLDPGLLVYFKFAIADLANLTCVLLCALGMQEQTVEADATLG